MPLYVYSDGRHTLEVAHSMATTDVPCVCGLCDQEMIRVPQGGAFALITGPRMVERKLVDRFVSPNPSGRDTVYETTEQAYRGELDRTGNKRIAEYNLRHLRRFGYTPDSPVAPLRKALNAAPGGRVGSSVVT